MEPNHVRLSFNLPIKHHMALKLLCEKKGQYMKDFLLEVMLREIERDSKDEKM